MAEDRTARTRQRMVVFGIDGLGLGPFQNAITGDTFFTEVFGGG